MQAKYHWGNSLPQVQIPLHVWQKLMAFVVSCPIEINGFGLIEKQGNVILVREIFILDQEASPGHAEVDRLALARHLFELTQRREDPGAIKFQWHSHVDMEAYFSGKDYANIERWPGDWLISLVANKSGHVECRLDIFKPLRVGIPITPRIVVDFEDELLVEAAEEIRAKVRSVVPTIFGGRKQRSVLHRVVQDSTTLDVRTLDLERGDQNDR